ncbi:Beta-keratin-related protein, partial [Leptosomus discolor]
PCGPAPLANSCNEPCVLRCADSTSVIEPSPVVVTLPGPIQKSTAVGSSLSAAVGSSLSAGGVPVSSG